MSTALSSVRVALPWLLAALYLALIWWLSSRQIDASFALIPFRDKGVHFVEFGALGLCLAEAVRGTWPGTGLRGMAAAWLFTAGAGLLDELHQAFVPGRSADVRDLFADAAGALFGVLCLFGLRDYLAALSTARQGLSKTGP